MVTARSTLPPYKREINIKFSGGCSFKCETMVRGHSSSIQRWFVWVEDVSEWESPFEIRFPFHDIVTDSDGWWWELSGQILHHQVGWRFDHRSWTLYFLSNHIFFMCCVSFIQNYYSIDFLFHFNSRWDKKCFFYDTSFLFLTITS